jgi:hypothetical protein
MATNPPSSIVAPMAAPLPVEFTKLTFRTLYIRGTDPGSKEMSQAGRPSDQLGRRNIGDCPIYDGRGSDASIVGRIQGITVLIGNAHQLVTIVFETERYLPYIYTSGRRAPSHASVRTYIKAIIRGKRM